MILSFLKLQLGGGGNISGPPRDAPRPTSDTAARPQGSLPQIARDSSPQTTNRPTSSSDQAPPPPPPSNSPSTSQSQSLLQSSLSQTELFSDMNSNMVMQGAETLQQDNIQENKSSQESQDNRDMSEARQKMVEKGFLMQSDDINRSRQNQFRQLTGSQKDVSQWMAKHEETLKSQDASRGQNAERARGNQVQENPLLKLRSQAQGLTKDNPDAPWKKSDSKMPLPKGYSAFMDVGPRGKQLMIMTQKLLKGQEGMPGENALAEEMPAETALEQENNQTAKAGQTAQGMSAQQKKLAKQMGAKDGVEDMLEAEEALVEEGETEEGSGVEEGDALSSLRRAMSARMARAKSKGGEGESEVGGAPWESFSEAIEAHTVLFNDAGHAESSNLVAQAAFASAVIYGAGMHIRVKGDRLNYSGTSHHGLPIPSGDEALEMGAHELVAGLERDVGQLGVESVFVNGQRFELANPDDERKLKELIKENPDLYVAIQGIREAIKEGRFYRTCMGLREEGPGGRA
ncbi:MAG: hypothetical protein HQM15_04275 [Deltaproteobacteria bacterium]|nr:hypothetical protein [Deltaproteobacteria bacterium]